ncbi:dipeptide ABC transporter ATP-binding protein [Arachidicoccus terrestris]|uniref:dipeptide ABC transporter ATP-binding protein n=1 Tax=Arachidicoccus terrestris TaxID=2875539 RepID=UPI001CC463EF|nr:ABC transporter ATP-binding protein [Arachidicoccus terrestris]UAY55036.1 ABC transporter ATP-binding protein [Arachidicoccus terrestris]
MQQKQNELVEINRLTISFGRNTVLRALDLTIGTGQTLAVVGESGSGKSLTALSLLQLLPGQAALSGEIFLKNAFKDLPPEEQKRQHTSINLTALNTRQMENIRGSQIAMIFQEPMTSLNPVKTCGDQVAEAIIAHLKIDRKTARARAIQLFTDVQLPDPAAVFDKYPHQISGGQKQRVMIAMAMSCSPRLLICDEPTTALDVMVQKEILQLIKDLQQKTNMSVLFISHDIQLVAEIADQIAVLYRGELVEYGQAGNIISTPSHPYTRALLSCRPGLYKRGERLPVVSDFLNKEDGRAALHDRTADIKVHASVSAPNREAGALLQIRKLQVWYPTKRDFWGRATAYFKAVKGMDLEVYKGETLGLVGGSGCGKTTLGRAIMGLTPIHDGSITFKGHSRQNDHSNSWQSATEMQMIFQDPYSALNPRITVGKAIGEALLVHGKVAGRHVKDKVCGWLERVGLQPAHYDRYPHEFSGGQRQRLVIARALILEPDFVICDESVSALDVSVQAQILNLFNDLKAQLGFTSIFISHDLSVVKYISDRIAVMNQGELEELGNADDIYERPQSAYTKSLLAAIPAPGLNRPI